MITIVPENFGVEGVKQALFNGGMSVRDCAKVKSTTLRAVDSDGCTFVANLENGDVKHVFVEYDRTTLRVIAYVIK